MSSMGIYATHRYLRGKVNTMTKTMSVSFNTINTIFIFAVIHHIQFDELNAIHNFTRFYNNFNAYL